MLTEIIGEFVKIAACGSAVYHTNFNTPGRLILRVWDALKIIPKFES
jgi:hypothetical protein